MIVPLNSTRIKRAIKRIPLLASFAVILTRIVPGYVQYRRLIKKYGDDVAILRAAWHGTGDYYICGMYLSEYLRLNEIINFVFLVNKTGSESGVMRLFSVFDGHIVTCRSVKCLSRFSEFMQYEKPLCKSLECSDQITFIGEDLKGYHGLTLKDFYLYYGFGFQKEPQACMPVFSGDIGFIRALMRDNGLIPGKTVLLAPYSTCLMKHLPTESIWEDIASHLQKSGYVVATNCFGHELPVWGTVPLSIDYTYIVPFLNEAGGFIGIRSGLCDIISRSTCRKMIIYTEKSDFWPDGRSEPFLSLSAMDFDKMADEITYRGKKLEFEYRIIDMIDGWKT